MTFRRREAHSESRAPQVILVLGFSNMFADALSMGMCDALSSMAENAAIEKERARERWELQNWHAR